MPPGSFRYPVGWTLSVDDWGFYPRILLCWGGPSPLCWSWEVVPIHNQSSTLILQLLVGPILVVQVLPTLPVRGKLEVGHLCRHFAPDVHHHVPCLSGVDIRRRFSHPVAQVLSLVPRDWSWKAQSGTRTRIRVARVPLVPLGGPRHPSTIGELGPGCRDGQ